MLSGDLSTHLSACISDVRQIKHSKPPPLALSFDKALLRSRKIVFF